MKTFVEDKLCPGQTRHNVNNLQIVKLLPIFLALVTNRHHTFTKRPHYRQYQDRGGALRPGEACLVTPLSHGAAWDGDH